MAQGEAPVKTRHKWTAAEKRELVRRLSKAQRGEATTILADFSERTGVAPTSIRAYYYAMLRKSGKSPGTPRRMSVEEAPSKNGSPFEKLAAQHARLRASVSEAEGSLAQAQKALADFEKKLASLA